MYVPKYLTLKFAKKFANSKRKVSTYFTKAAATMDKIVAKRQKLPSKTPTVQAVKMITLFPSMWATLGDSTLSFAFIENLLLLN